MKRYRYGLRLLAGAAVIAAALTGHDVRAYSGDMVSTESPAGSGPFGRVVSVSEHKQTHEIRTAFLLADGRLFLPGSGTVEPPLWNPQERVWRTVGRAPYCHSGSFTGTLLADGRVLIAGGMEQGNICEKLKTTIWDLMDQKHVSGPLLLEGRASHTATLLSDGTVLFAGGRSNDFGKMRILGSVELFDGTSFRALPPLKVARMQHTATRLKDGRVLVAGGAGNDGRSVAAVEIWDPARRVWESARPMRSARRTHTAHLLADGRVMVTGGLNNASLQPAAPDALGRTMDEKDRGDQAIASTEIWDPVSDQWQPGPPLLFPSAWHSALTLRNGNILLIAPPLLGDKSKKRVDMSPPPVMLWERQTGVWLPAGQVERGVARSPTNNDGVTDSAGLPMVALEDGSALIVTRKHVLRWLPEKSTGSQLPIYGGRSAIESRLPDGRLLLTGGRDHRHSENNQFANEREKEAEREAYYRKGARDLLRDDRSFPDAPTGMQRGQPESLGLSDAVEIFDPRTGRFTLTGRLNQPRRWHEALVLADGRVVVAGGLAASADSPEAAQARITEIWDPKTGIWRALRSELRFEAQQKVYLNQLRDGRVLFFVVRVTERGNETAFRAVLWHPDRDTAEVRTVPVRSQHRPSVAILDDGRVLIVGSQQAQIWDSRSGNVSVMESPGVPQTFWRTRALRSRHVLFLQLYASEFDSRGNSSAARLWDPVTGRWSRLADLPGPYYTGKRLVEMDDGSIYVETGDKAFLLPTNAMSWVETSRAPFDTYHNTLSDSVAQSELSGQSGQFAWLDPESRAWVKLPRAYLPRKRPAMAAFEDGRVLIAAGEQQSLVQIWKPGDDSWTEAPSLSRPYSSGSLVRFGANRFLFVGRGGTDLGCEVFHADANRWKDCGKFSSQSKFVLGPLGQHRAVLLFGNREAAIYNIHNNTWTTSRIEIVATQKPPQHQNARVVQANGHSSPFTRVWDPDDQTWVDVTPLAMPWRENYRAVYLNDGRLLKTDRSIWKRDTHEAVRMPNTALIDPPLGQHLHLLPDGCVLSWAPFYLISVDATRHAYLPEPYIGIEEASSLRLADGTFMLAGMAVGSNQPGAGVARIEASCRGVERVGQGLSEMPGARLSSKPLDLDVTTASAKPQNTSRSEWMNPWLREHLWAVLAIFSMFGVLIYFRFAMWRRDR